MSKAAIPPCLKSATITLVLKKPATRYSEELEKVETFQFQGILLLVDLSQSHDTTATIKKAQQRLHFPSVLRRYGMDRKLRA